MFLKEDGGHRAFLPDCNSRPFRFTSDVGVTMLSLFVEGTSSTPEPSENVVIATPTPLPGPSLGSFHPYQAQRPNKISFVNHGQMFTTVPYLSSMIQEKWGEGYVLVTSDGLRLEDSDGTRGMYKPIHNIGVLVSVYPMQVLKFGEYRVGRYMLFKRLNLPPKEKVR